MPVQISHSLSAFLSVGLQSPPGKDMVGSYDDEDIDKKDYGRVVS